MTACFQFSPRPADGRHRNWARSRFDRRSPVYWVPELFTGVGDFAQLRSYVQDLDACRANTSWQVNFVDDGVVVPGTGGTPCISWCYGPDGWIGGWLGSDGSPAPYFDDVAVRAWAPDDPQIIVDASDL